MLNVLSPKASTIDCIRQLNIQAIRVTVFLLDYGLCYGVYFYGLIEKFLFLKKLSLSLECMYVQVYNAVIVLLQDIPALTAHLKCPHLRSKQLHDPLSH
jgi:hypothetical protein